MDANIFIEHWAFSMKPRVVIYEEIGLDSNAISVNQVGIQSEKRM